MRLLEKISSRVQQGYGMENCTVSPDSTHSESQADSGVNQLADSTRRSQRPIY